MLLSCFFFHKTVQQFYIKDYDMSNETVKETIRYGSLMVSRHGLYVGSPGSIPTAVTTRTAGGDAEHVSLNH